MTIYETDNEQVITYYEYYLNLKTLINELKELKKYLNDNNIIKRSDGYIVLKNDKFGYRSYKKYRKILLNNYISQDKIMFVEKLFMIIQKYQLYDGRNDYELIYNSEINLSSEEIKEMTLDVFGLLDLDTLINIKLKLRKLIEAELFNIHIYEV